MISSLSGTRFAAFAIAGCLAPSLAAQGSYTDLGPGSAYSTSDDASAVAIKDGGTYRWTPGGGRVEIRPFEGIGGFAAISADGTRVVTDIKDNMGDTVAGMWDISVGNFVSLGFLPNALRCPSRSDAYDISADGSTVVGLSWDGCKGRAFTWNAGAGMTELLPLILSRSSRANAVSGDGRVVTGWDTAQNGSRRAMAWLPGGPGQLLIPSSQSNPDGAGEAWAVNHDGSLIVGGETNGEAFRWRPVGGIEFLGELAGEENTPFPYAYGTTDDGSMIVGGVGSAFGGAVAWIWSEEDGMRRLDEVLAENDITLPPGNPLAWGFDITPDGKHIVGQRGTPLMPGGDRAFRVRMPEGFKYGVDATPSHVLDLRGTGSDQIGGTLVMNVTGIKGPVAYWMFSRDFERAGAFPYKGGMILTKLDSSFELFPLPASNGVSTLPLFLRNDPALIGVVFYMQNLGLDSAQPDGISFSNGLKIRIRG